MHLCIDLFCEIHLFCEKFGDGWDDDGLGKEWIATDTWAVWAEAMRVTEAFIVWTWLTTFLNDRVVQTDSWDVVFGHDDRGLVVQITDASIVDFATHVRRSERKQQFSLRLQGDHFLGDHFKLCCVDVWKSSLSRLGCVSKWSIVQSPVKHNYIRLEFVSFW